MRGRFISVVSLYGPKTGPVRDFLAGVQALIAAQVGDAFRPYSLDQVHATLIALDGVADPETGAAVNDYYLEHTGSRRPMDLRQVMDIVAARFADPLRVRIGGFARQQAVAFTSGGRHPFERTCSVQGNAFVLIGWPSASLSGLCGAARPLDDLRRAMNAANVLHKYHSRDTDVDNDLYLVLGHHAGAPAGALQRAVAAVRDTLAAGPIELDIALADVKVVAADSHTLAPPLYVSDIPADEAILHALMS
jgi:hypothetical protein